MLKAAGLAGKIHLRTSFSLLSNTLTHTQLVVLGCCFYSKIQRQYWTLSLIIFLVIHLFYLVIFLFFYRSDMDDILSVLTRVNAKVSKGIYKGFKQMPEPKYTFTKKLVLKPV